MPLLIAFAASALLHAAALVGSGWALPGSEAPEPPATPLEAVIARPAPRVEPPPKAAPPPAARPRHLPAGLARAPEPATTVAAPELPRPVAVAPPPSEPPPAAPPAAMPEPAPPVPATTALAGRGQVRYAITRGEGGFVVGQATHTWEHDGFRYRLRSVTETTGLAALFKPARVVQSSEGELANDGLQPREFRHERVGGVDTASFDWPGRVVAFAGRREVIVNGTQDMLSMYYQLVLLAPTQGALDMPIATGRKLENYRFEVLGEETLAVPAGQRRALRVRTRSGGDTIELWLQAGEGAASRGLPLKIRFIDRKGEIFDQIADEAGETQ